jgi:hypothetical protein
MKKIFLLFGVAALSYSAKAQLTLTGTSYTQNFNSLGTGLPTGWTVYKEATASTLGTLESFSPSTSFGSYYDTTNCASSVYGKGFKNCASANTASMATAPCATQQTQTDRALGVKQVGPTTYAGLDPGASFVLKIANTLHDTGFNVSFKLQSLDQANCPRVTTWVLEYGLGTSPSSYIAVPTTGTMTTGGNTFSNNTITAHLPAAVNNQSGMVTLRISALAGSTSTGSRTTTGIDDFSLTWTSTSTGITSITSASNIILNVLGNATSDKINFEYSVAESEGYNFTIYDLSGRVLHSRYIDAQAGTQQIAVDGLHLAPGMYFARMNNSNNSTVAKIMVQ